MMRTVLFIAILLGVYTGSNFGAMAQMPYEAQGFYLLDNPDRDGAENCFGGMKNDNVIWINERGFVPSGGLTTGEVCLYSNLSPQGDGSFTADASCKLRLLPDNDLKTYGGKVRGTLLPFGGSQAIALDDGRTITELYARKCDFPNEIALSVGQAASNFSLMTGEKAAVLYGYYDVARVVCDLPAISKQTSQCIGSAVGGLMARDYPSDLQNAKRMVIDGMTAGAEAFKIDQLQIPTAQLCEQLEAQWDALFRACLVQ